MIIITFWKPYVASSLVVVTSHYPLQEKRRMTGIKVGNCFDECAIYYKHFGAIVRRTTIVTVFI